METMFTYQIISAQAPQILFFFSSSFSLANPLYLYPSILLYIINVLQSCIIEHEVP